MGTAVVVTEVAVLVIIGLFFSLLDLVALVLGLGSLAAAKTIRGRLEGAKGWLVLVLQLLLVIGGMVGEGVGSCRVVLGRGDGHACRAH